MNTREKAMALNEKIFPSTFRHIQIIAAKISESRGWNFETDETTISSKICLMHSELSEALEGLRIGNPPSEHIPEFSAMEEEFADTIIRIMHVAEKMELKIGEAILAKLEFNTTRPHKHGEKLF